MPRCSTHLDRHQLVIELGTSAGRVPGVERGLVVCFCPDPGKRCPNAQLQTKNAETAWSERSATASSYRPASIFTVSTGNPIDSLVSSVSHRAQLSGRGLRSREGWVRGARVRRTDGSRVCRGVGLRRSRVLVRHRGRVLSRAKGCDRIGVCMGSSMRRVRGLDSESAHGDKTGKVTVSSVGG